ncbi:VOC family protein, partial [Cellulosimicrobium sp. CUA-896]|uniref:VOC family protein n=1 Tax=Cellulosimicrobium sp. CUA-896 TaxID=1517881 RepID=UPI001C9E6F36
QRLPAPARRSGRVDEPGLWLVPLPDGAAPPDRHGLPDLVLYVDHVDATLDRLAGLGVEPFEGPDTDAASGDRSAHVHDPDGHHVILVRLGGTRS